MSRYGGPFSQNVDVKFGMTWHHYLAAVHKYIVVTVDGRGTGFKGRKLRNPVKDQLGHYETIDQINAAKYVSTPLPTFIAVNDFCVCAGFGQVRIMSMTRGSVYGDGYVLRCS